MNRGKASRSEAAYWEQVWADFAAGTRRPDCGFAVYQGGPKNLPRWRRFTCTRTSRPCACSYHSRQRRGPALATNWRECPGRLRATDVLTAKADRALALLLKDGLLSVEQARQFMRLLVRQRVLLDAMVVEQEEGT